MPELVLYLFMPLIAGASFFLVAQAVFHVFALTWSLLLNFFRRGFL